MDLSGIPQPKMDWSSGNLLPSFKQFIQHAELILKGALKKKEDEIKVTYLLLWIGIRGREIYNTLVLTNAQKKSSKDIFDKFEQHVQPKSNRIFSRYKFKNQVQNDMPMEKYITALKTLATDCVFGDSRDDMIRDQIVFGVKSEKIREKLITKGDSLTLAIAESTCLSHKYAQHQLKTTNNQAVPTVDILYERKPSKPRRKHNPPRAKPVPSQPRPSQPAPARQKPSSKCCKCGYLHRGNPCEAKGQQCHVCKGWNHFESVCFKKQGAQSSVHDINDISGDDSEFEIDGIIDGINGYSGNQAYADIQVGPKRQSISLKIDTGASCNILTEKDFHSLGIKFPLIKSSCDLAAYNGAKLQVLGKINLECSHKATTKNVQFYVLRSGRCSIFGVQSSLDFNLIKMVMAVDKPVDHPQTHMSKDQILSDYPDLFSGIGHLPGKVTLKLDPAVQPSIHPPRRVPVSLKEKVHDELKRMVKADIITPVSTPTPWVSSMIVVSKQGSNKVRICLDPRDLNKALRRPHFPMRTIDEILPELSSAKSFTKLDCKKGYWSMELDENSSYLTTFNSPLGRFRYKLTPFGLVTSQDDFQRRMDEFLENLTGSAVICDDILVWGSCLKSLDENLRKVLQRCREKGIRLSPEKVEIGLQEVRYFGHVLSSDSMKPDPDKIAAIRDMDPPQNKAELETIMGLIVYLSRFAGPNLSEVTAPLRELLKKRHDLALG